MAAHLAQSLMEAKQISSHNGPVQVEGVLAHFAVRDANALITALGYDPPEERDTLRAALERTEAALGETMADLRAEDEGRRAALVELEAARGRIAELEAERGVLTTENAELREALAELAAVTDNYDDLVVNARTRADELLTDSSPVTAAIHAVVEAARAETAIDFRYGGREVYTEALEQECLEARSARRAAVDHLNSIIIQEDSE